MDDGVYAAARCHRFSIRFFCPCAKDRRLHCETQMRESAWLRPGTPK